MDQIFDEDLAGIFEASPERRVRTCNPAFARLFGFASPEDAIGADLSLLDPEGMLAARFCELAAPARNGLGAPVDDSLATDGELELRSIDGRVLHVTARLVGRFGAPDGRDGLSSVTGYLIDDTRRKALQVQVRHAMKMEAVGRLAGGIAHDFNNLLMIIIGLSEGLVEQMQPDDPLRPDAIQILEAGRRGSALASQVLAFSRKPLARASRFDADEVIAAATPLIARLLGTRITLELSCAPGAKWIFGDRAQLEQVLLNLATNAHDAMPDGGRLVVDTYISTSGPERHGSAATTPRVVIRMRDTGLGMSPETQAHIFEPFFTTKVRGKGTGLGLSQVHAIVTEHGGIIDVESADGAGTTFTISLPVALAPEPQTA